MLNKVYYVSIIENKKRGRCDIYHILIMRWYSKTGTQYRDKLFYIRGVSDEKTV
jgi:hypothetical protein